MRERESERERELLKLRGEPCEVRLEGGWEEIRRGSEMLKENKELKLQL